MNRLREYTPALSLVAASVLGALISVTTDNQVTTPELLALLLLVLSGVTTYIVPRTPQVPWLKPAVAFAFAGVEAAGAALSNGISMSEWVLIGVAALGAVGVAATNRQVPFTVSGSG